MTHRRARRWAGWLLVLVATAIARFPASAQTIEPETGPEPGSGGMILLGQTDWVESNGIFEVVVRLPGVYDFDDEMTLSVHERVDTVADFRATLGAARPGEVLGSVTTTLADLSPSRDGAATLAMRLTDGTVEAAADGEDGAGSGDDVPGLELATPGVYPVTVTMRTADQATIGSLVTHAVRVPSGSGVVTPMPVATVIDLHAGPSAGPGSAPSPAQLARIQPWIGALQATELPATLRITPWLLDARGTIGLPAQLRQIVATREVGRGPWVRVDEATLAADGLGALVPELWERGDQTLRQELSIEPTAGLWISDTDTPSSRDRYAELARVGVASVVLPASAVDDVTGRAESAGGVLDVGGDRFTAIVSLGERVDELVDTDDPILAVHHLLGELAVRSFAGDRSATLLLHSEQDLGAAAITELVQGLATSTLHEPTTASAVLAGVPTASAEPGTTSLIPVDGPIPEMAGDPQLRTQAFDTIDGYRSMIFDADTDVAYDSLRSDLLVSVSSDVTADERNVVWRQTTSRVLQEVDAITPPPPIEVLLTSPDGVVPFSFENALDYPVRVEVRFVSDKVTFTDIDDGETATLVLEPGVTTTEFAVRALTSGRFPLELVIRSPDGTLPLADQRVNVRSTALSGIGIAAAIGAAAFLLLWWFVQWRRRRSDQSSVDEPFWTESSLPEKVSAGR